VREAGVNVCLAGILCMGERRGDRIDTLLTAHTPEEDADAALFDRLGLRAMAVGSHGTR